MLTLETVFIRVAPITRTGRGGVEADTSYCGQPVHACSESRRSLGFLGARPGARWALRSEFGGVPFAWESYFCEPCALALLARLNSCGCGSRSEVEGEVEL
jgi:hypothetical protein